MTSVRRAVVLVYKGLARVVSPETYETFSFESWVRVRTAEGEECIRTVSMTIRLPEAILLSTYDSVPHSQVPFTRKNLYRRDRYLCQYCHRRPKPEDLTIDHITPRSRGGSSTWTNCVVACTQCNTKKSDRTVNQAGMKLVKAPTKPKWHPHIHVPAQGQNRSWSRFFNGGSATG